MGRPPSSSFTQHPATPRWPTSHLRYLTSQKAPRDVRHAEVLVPGNLVNLVFPNFLMKQCQIARNHLYAGGSCLPSNFGLVTSEPRLRSVFSCSITMKCAARLLATRQGVIFPNFRAFPRPTFSGLFLIFCTAGECGFSKLYLLPQLVFILLSTFVQVLSLARPCISSHQQQP